MSTETEFIAAVIADPDNDALRLVYADWLEERGDPRGEFIRVQCEIASIRDEHCANSRIACTREHGYCFGDVIPCERCRLRRRERELLAEGPSAVPNSMAWRWNIHPDIQVTFHRGFVERIGCRALDWLQRADVITATAPIRAVDLAGMPLVAIDQLETIRPWRHPPRHGESMIEAIGREWAGIHFYFSEVGFAAALGRFIPFSFPFSLDREYAEHVERGQYAVIEGVLWCHPEDRQLLLETIDAMPPEAPA